MKITDVRVHLVQPLDIGDLVPGNRLGWVFVEVETDEGITGIGECSNWPRKGDVIVGHAVETIRDSVIGRDPSHIEAIWVDLFRQYTYLGSRGVISMVVSGIDIALWDIKGKMLGKPIYDLLGGPVREGIDLYTHPAGQTPAEMYDGCRELIDRGYKALKTDPFREMAPRITSYLGGQISNRGIAEGAELVAAMRDAAGTDVDILIDMHGNFNATTALRCIRALEPYGVAWIEEPVPPESIAALRQIRAQTDVDLCVGERLYTRYDFAPILSEGLANYIMPDVCWCGGISELRRIAALAETYYVPISPHDALGPIQILAGSHVMRATPNFYRLEIANHWFDLYNECISPGIDVRDGVLYLSDAPGLGAELNMDWIRAHPDPDWRAP